MKTIRMTFKPDGSASVSTSGYAGAECLAASDALERALGKVEKNEATPEMSAVAEEVADNLQG
jgi:hypothetical protein